MKYKTDQVEITLVPKKKIQVTSGVTVLEDTLERLRQQHPDWELLSIKEIHTDETVPQGYRLVEEA